MIARVLTSFAMIVCLAESPASASSIGLYFALDGSDCDASVGANQAFTLYILADLYGDAAVAGILAAEFRVRNWPSGWTSSATPNPSSNISFGDPLVEGAIIGFAACQLPGANGIVLLYTIDAVATTVVANLNLIVDRHTTPNNPNFLCPQVYLCDIVFPPNLCVSGGQAFINGPTCNVGLAPSTWTQLKGLYGSH